MGHKHTAWVWEHSQAKGGTRLVALALADCINSANDDDLCWPRQDKLAKMVRLTLDSVSRCVKELEALGELEIHRTQRGNEYRLTMDKSPSGTHAESAGSRIGTHAGSHSAPTPVSNPAPTPDPYVEPEVEPERTGTRGDGGQAALLPDPIEELWEHYRQRVPDGQKQRTTTRTAEIRKALKVRSLDDCKRAIDGLAASTYHHGQNEQRATYLELEYALGKLKWERDRCADKIDEMGKRAAKAATGQPEGGAVPVAELTAKYQGYAKDLVLGKMGDVRQALFQPSELNLRLAVEAEAWLRDECRIVVAWRDGNRIGWARACLPRALPRLVRLRVVDLSGDDCDCPHGACCSLV